LAHQPAAIHEAAEHGVDFQLSGHTHGGQIWPFKYLVYLQQPYVEGLHRYRDTATQIYVSPGTGFWGPPMRLGTEAEITHITLRAGT
jgi:predicted MPP superfamily phosphohydrolase